MSWRAGLRSGSSSFDAENRQAAIDLEDSLRREQARKRAVRAALQRPPSTGTPSRPGTPPLPPPEDIMPDPPAAAVDYAAEAKEDGATSQSEARSIKIEWDPSDVKFWFSQLEGEMLMASMGSQWLKKTIYCSTIYHQNKKKT